MSNLAPIPESWIEKLFHKMLLEYGKKFTDQWGMVDTSEMIKHWSHELAGYSGEEVKRGVDALSSRSWPPTLPDFKTMCRAPVDPLKAYYEAVAGVQARINGEMGEWSHPAIYWASVPLGIELREQGYSQVKARWEASLDKSMAKGAWDAIPRPMMALAAPSKSKITQEEASQRLRELGASTVINDHRGGDARGWAKRILERVEAGEKMPTISVKFAREALGAE